MSSFDSARFQQERAGSFERVRHLVRETDHPDAEEILREFDSALWDAEMGVAQARATWAALSEPQRRTLRALSEGRALARCAWSTAIYDAMPMAGVGCELEALRDVCRVATVKALLSRDLLASDNPSDVMKRLTLSRYAGFVLKINIEKTCGP